LIQGLAQAARPGYLDSIDGGVVAEAKVQGARRVRQVAARGADLAGQDAIALVNVNDRADRVAIALRAAPAEFDIVLSRQLVLEVIRLVVEVVDHDVQESAMPEVRGHGTPRASHGGLAADRVW